MKTVIILVLYLVFVAVLIAISKRMKILTTPILKGKAFIKSAILTLSIIAISMPASIEYLKENLPTYIILGALIFYICLTSFSKSCEKDRLNEKSVNPHEE